jgi:hypothetical protein
MIMRLAWRYIRGRRGARMCRSDRPWNGRFGKHPRRWASANLWKSRSLLHRGPHARMAKVRTSSVDSSVGIRACAGTRSSSPATTRPRARKVGLTGFRDHAPPPAGRVFGRRRWRDVRSSALSALVNALAKVSAALPEQGQGEDRDQAGARDRRDQARSASLLHGDQNRRSAPGRRRLSPPSCSRPPVRLRGPMQPHLKAAARRASTQGRPRAPSGPGF